MTTTTTTTTDDDDNDDNDDDVDVSLLRPAAENVLLYATPRSFPQIHR